MFLGWKVVDPVLGIIDLLMGDSVELFLKTGFIASLQTVSQISNILKVIKLY